jgi:cbb3-type cytochrome oxidase subunit 3
MGTATGKGVLIGMLSAFGSAAIIAIILLVIWFFQYTQRGSEYDDEQAFLKEEAEALEEMDDMQRMEYLRAKGAYYRWIRMMLY